MKPTTDQQWKPLFPAAKARAERAEWVPFHSAREGKEERARQARKSRYRAAELRHRLEAGTAEEWPDYAGELAAQVVRANAERRYRAAEEAQARHDHLAILTALSDSYTAAAGGRR